jgi:hypothetical protein
MKAANLRPTLLRVLALGLCALWLAGCGSSLNKVVRSDPGSPQGFVQVEADFARHVSVFRDGRPLALRVPLALRAGDEIQTAPGAGAVIRLEGDGEVVLGPDTRVRLGSLELLFGRILADVRGLFNAESENIVAGVEGTLFQFEVDQRQDVRVVVLEGAVQCRSKRDGWEPIRLERGQALSSAYPNRMTPHVEPVSRAEMAAIEHWAEEIRGAARAGWCCQDGRVYEARSDRCRGLFTPSEREAHEQCTPGWCCSDGRVTRTIRAQCRGSFHHDPEAAERACAPRPAPEPEPEPSVRGWCCINGEVAPMERRACSARGGSFHSTQRRAAAACDRPVYEPPKYDIIRPGPLEIEPRERDVPRIE